MQKLIIMIFRKVCSRDGWSGTARMKLTEEDDSVI